MICSTARQIGARLEYSDISRLQLMKERTGFLAARGCCSPVRSGVFLHDNIKAENNSKKIKMAYKEVYMSEKG